MEVLRMKKNEEKLSLHEEFVDFSLLSIIQR